MTAAARPDRLDVAARLARLVRPTLPELWIFLALALPGLAALLATLPTVDLAYGLRAGADILAGRGIPVVDAWTFTAGGRPWLDQQWGAQALFAAVYGATGWPGLAILRAALVVAIQGMLVVAIRRRAPRLGSRTVALFALAAFVVTAPALALRPQLVGMALFVGSLAVLTARRSSPTVWWVLPVLAIAWVNVHGSFVLAPVLVGLAWLDDLHDRSPGARRTLLMVPLTAVATLANPFGIGVWQYALSLSTNREVTARITEWQSPTLGDGAGILFWTSVAAVVVAVAAIWRGRRPPWPALLALAAFAALGAVAGRGVAWWPAIAVVTLAGMLATPTESGGSSRPGREPLRRPLNAFVAGLLIVAGIGLLPTWRPIDAGLRAPTGLLAFAPSGITAALRDLATPADRVWNPQVWGSWLEFAVPAPAYALDARVELIPSAVWSEADVVAAAGPGWDAILDRCGVTIVVTEGAEASPLAAALRASGGWQVAFADADGTVWTRLVHR